MRYRGSCHCGAVQFEVEAPEQLEVLDCNCSICSKAGYLHLIRPASAFQLLAGPDMLTTYTFNTGVARHTFCRRCGIKPFYVPRSNPDGIDVNARCLDPVPASLSIVPFDGRNWEAHAHELAHKSRQHRSPQQTLESARTNFAAALQYVRQIISLGSWNPDTCVRSDSRSGSRCPL